MSDQSQSSILRIWFLPFSILTGSSMLVFAFTFYFDTDGRFDQLGFLLNPNPATAFEILASTAEVVAAVLGLAITVVAIVVELAANRYTHRITELFVHEPINFATMGFFVVTAIQAVLVASSFDIQSSDVPGHMVSGHAPIVGVTVSIAMLCLGLLVLLPYFAFVFDFLNPINIVDRMRRAAVRTVEKTKRLGVEARQAEAVRGIEQLADVGLNAMEHKDKGVSMASVDALQGLVLDYQPIRHNLETEWFQVEGDLAHNPDFVSMSESVLEAVSRRRIWFEMKVLRKYQTLYNQALNKERDINYLIAINTRHIAERAADDGHHELFELVVKFYNTYLRSTVNAKDVRTAYNVLYQYRQVASHVLLMDDGKKAIEIAKYFKYYGLVSFNVKLPFILETVAYDLCALNEEAFARNSPASDQLLAIFLQVDKESDGEVQEVSLRGVRKAQVKLATYYLARGAKSLARRVYEDMAQEDKNRMASIRDELLGVKSSEFWEISDRGENFDYLEPERKAQLMTFFGWFDGLPAPRPDLLPEDYDPAPPDSEALDQHSGKEILAVETGGTDPAQEDD